MSKFILFGNQLSVLYEGIACIISRGEGRCTVIHKFAPFDIEMSVEDAHHHLEEYEKGERLRQLKMEDDKAERKNSHVPKSTKTTAEKKPIAASDVTISDCTESDEKECQ